MKNLAIGLLIGALLFLGAGLAACSSGSARKPAPAVASTAAPTPIQCASLTGQTVDPGKRCQAPIAGLISPTAFPCYTAPGSDFYYFNINGQQYVYGLAGGQWRAAPFTQSLGPIATALGC